MSSSKTEKIITAFLDKLIYGNLGLYIYFKTGDTTVYIPMTHYTVEKEIKIIDDMEDYDEDEVKMSDKYMVYTIIGETQKDEPKSCATTFSFIDFQIIKAEHRTEEINKGTVEDIFEITILDTASAAQLKQKYLFIFSTGAGVDLQHPIYEVYLIK
jgi:hypothetical protein